MTRMTDARWEKQTSAVLVALFQAVARLVGQLRLGHEDASRRAVDDARSALHGLALLLGHHRGLGEQAGRRLAGLLAERGYPIPAVEALGQGSYTVFHAFKTLPSTEHLSSSSAGGQNLASLSDDEGDWLEPGQRSTVCPCFHGDVRAELRTFRQTVDGRDDLVMRAATQGLAETETARLSGLARNTVRSILRKGPGTPSPAQQGAECGDSMERPAEA